MELPKNYDPATAEKPLYERWSASGYFNPDNLPDQEGAPFTVMMPPPNVTGILHAGHALFLTIQDVFIRHARMRGRRALWVPGTDHAAIATQARVEKDLVKKEGKNRHDLGREEFLKRVNAFALESQTTILGQMKAMGASCDWSRLAYTLDAPRHRAVNEAFKRLHDLGLIYRGNRIVNWDPKGQTTISDDEIVHEERPAKLWTFRYAKDFPIPIATTRPETKVGDVAVAVHPDDERYREFIGSEHSVTFAGVPLRIKIVADTVVDPSFGTGAVGVTPAHSMTDWDIARRHNLPAPQVINEYARMSVEGPLKDLKVAEAREKVVEWLNSEGLLEKEEDITHNVATAERTGGLVEPLPKLQWFIAVTKPFTTPDGRTATLKELMADAVTSDAIRIVPDRFANNYFHWINNLRDWCISRQIWFGHRIPVWYRGDELHVGTEPAGEGWSQDEDTLDTWFSSGLWTFSTLGWPESTRDLKTFHPTDVLETAYEILFFWVARMVLMSTALMGEVPFRVVYLHGLVRDANRAKLSKSKADSANPLDLIAKYGTDALRMALVFNTSPGTDSVLSEEKIRGMKHFANKLWNIARFIQLNLPNGALRPPAARPTPTTDADRDILAKLDATTASVTRNLEGFAIHEAAQAAYDFAWHELADVYLEASKPQLQDPALADGTRAILAHCLATTLKLLHPFMPFVTEELWGRLTGGTEPADMLMVQKWPESA